jgi:hypothetical protein
MAYWPTLSVGVSEASRESLDIRRGSRLCAATLRALQRVRDTRGVESYS